MPSLPKAYNPAEVEEKIYSLWEKSGFFNPDNLKPVTLNLKPFVIAMPPPNATGTLHMGHALAITLEDLMIRYHRMLGEKTLYLPGTDHAAIATQTKVEKLVLAKEKKNKYDLGREEFLKRIEEFIKNSQQVIRRQIRQLGASCDWSRERYTLDEGLSEAVETMFLRMQKDGLIYQGDRLVNWCPRCESTLADDEVEYREEKGKLYFIKYDDIIIATTRPETMLGDTAVAVNPKDKRYKKFIGKMIILPLVSRHLPVIADSLVDPEFGTGALKVTPAHDPNDFLLGEKHKLEFINIFDKNARIICDGPYKGLSRYQAREEIIKDLGNKLVKTEDHLHRVGHCYRCGKTIEPLISKQWFIKVEPLKKKAIEAIKKGKIKIIPQRFAKVYFHWMKNLHDWCISRQIWFGHSVPVKGSIDTLDTWFSSALWTFSTLGWPKSTKDLKEFHPTSVMETGYDILFFWVARMIMMSLYALGEVPFKVVYLHGLVRTKEGAKMSKSLGNIIDPLEMAEKYGMDAVRLSLIMGIAPGNDLKIYEEKIKGMRNFINKLWNIARFILLQGEIKTKEIKLQQPEDKQIILQTQKLIKEVTKFFEEYKFGQALEVIHEFTWHEFADKYIEFSKKEISERLAILYHVLVTILKLLHPFAPFVTEEIWQRLGEKSLLMIEKWPKSK